MRKRLDMFWRVAVVLLVVMVVAPVVVSSGSTQAAISRPDTYMNPIPDYLNGGLVTTGQSVLTPGIISGTSLDAVPVTQRVANVQVQIRRDWDNSYWLDGAPGSWVDDAPDTWNSVLPAHGTLVQESTLGWGAFDQWRWVYAPTWTAANFDSGKSYTVRARALDNSLPQGYNDSTPATDVFIYDNQVPDVSFTTLFPAIVYDLNVSSINGNASDDDGVLDQVRMQIRRGAAPPYSFWNGFAWVTGAANRVWIKAPGTSSWSINSSTNPPLPKWAHGQTYRVEVQASDKADNKKNNGPYTFMYRKTLTASGTAGSNYVYIDPLPTAANVMAGFSGTSKAVGGQTIVVPGGVKVEIEDVTLNLYWSTAAAAPCGGGCWTGNVLWPDCPTAVVVAPAPGYDQYDWTCAKPGTLNWIQGHTYQIRAQATDNVIPTPNTYISANESFTYDDPVAGAPAASSIDAFDNEVYNVWNSLTGNCQDDMYGKIVAEVILIQRNSDSLFWNGAGWGAVPWGVADAWDWIFAAPQSGQSFNQNYVKWMVTSSTNPALPPLANDVQYTVTAHSIDWAGNEESTATKIFTFRWDMSYTAPTATATAGPTGTGGPTATSHATATSTVVPTGTTASATATATVPTATKTPTPTVTTVPGFSGSGTIGAGVGTVVAEDSNGDTRVTASFDANAFGSDTGVTISGSGNCNAVGAAPSGYSKGTSCFDIEPEGDLGANVEVCVYYQPADTSAGGGDPANLTLAYKDGGTWVILDTTVDKGAGTLCAETTQIGTFAVLGKAAAEGGEWVWWYYLLIGLGALLVVAIIVLILIRPKGEGEGAAEEGYEEEEEI